MEVIYLSLLVVLLTVAAIFILLQIIKTRRIENTFSRLQKKLKDKKGTAEEYYELGSLYLDKKIYKQSITLFQKALKAAEKEEIEPQNKALIYNAMGFTYAAQEQYDLAIRQYKEALSNYPDYVIALNNLANIYEKKQMIAKALEFYEQSLKYEPNNNIAKRRSESLRKRLVTADNS